MMLGYLSDAVRASWLVRFSGIEKGASLQKGPVPTVFDSFNSSRDDPSTKPEWSPGPPRFGPCRFFGGGVGEVDYPPAVEKPTVGDADNHGAMVSAVHHPHLGSERQRRVTCRQFIHVEDFTACGGTSLNTPPYQEAKPRTIFPAYCV